MKGNTQNKPHVDEYFADFALGGFEQKFFPKNLRVRLTFPIR